MSPRNTVAATASLMERTGSHRILSQPMFASLTSQVKALLEAKGWAVQVDDCPEFGQVYPELAPNSEAPEVVPYMFGKPSSLDDIALYMHSSGSTGMPKPIAHTFLNSLHWGKNCALSSPPAYAYIDLPGSPVLRRAQIRCLVGCDAAPAVPLVRVPAAPHRAVRQRLSHWTLCAQGSRPTGRPDPEEHACGVQGDRYKLYSHRSSIPRGALHAAHVIRYHAADQARPSQAWAHSDEDVAYLKTLFSVVRTIPRSVCLRR